MEIEKIIILVLSILSVFVFIKRYKWQSLIPNVPDPWFSIIVVLILIYFCVFPVTLFSPKFFSESFKDYFQTIPFIFIILEMGFRKKT